MKNEHEIRDPLYAFIKINSKERKVIDSYPFQRLRHIHQLALTNLVYPGATHKRFEHSLGTMELATRVFEIVTNSDNIHHDIRESGIIPLKDDLPYWKKVVRMAALCHDLGHLPFSHAAEELLPAGKSHEYMTKEIIESGCIRDLLEDMQLNPKHVSKIAIGPEKSTESFNAWEAILSEIVTSDTFGMDRVDYLLRDSYYAGVMYGKVDYFRLVDTMRILPRTTSKEPVLGIEKGGVHLVENLLLSRYFMYLQVYFHPVRKIYDLHLVDYMKTLYPGRSFPIKVDDFLGITDDEIFMNLRLSVYDKTKNNHIFARRIMCREHFKLVCNGNYKSKEKLESVYSDLVTNFGAEKIKKYSKVASGGSFDFPVLIDEKKVSPVGKESQMIGNNMIPNNSVFYIYADRDICKNVKEYIDKKRGEHE